MAAQSPSRGRLPPREGNGATAGGGATPRDAAEFFRYSTVQRNWMNCAESWREN